MHLDYNIYYSLSVIPPESEHRHSAFSNRREISIQVHVAVYVWHRNLKYHQNVRVININLAEAKQRVERFRESDYPEPCDSTSQFRDYSLL